MDQNLNILLIDEDSNFTAVLTKRLARRGITTVCANSPQQTMAALRLGSYDLATLDLRQKALDGLEFLRVLHKMEPGMPILILTGHASIHEAREAVRRGACGYLLKPYDFEELLLRIKESAAGLQNEDLLLNISKASS